MMKVSVVIPCRNEKAYIGKCIDAIYSSDLSIEIDLTVIVVDGMSDDGTREELYRLQNNYPTLKVIDNKDKLTPIAFNLGINFCEFDYLQIIGARHIISSNYISKSLEVLQNHPEIWCVGGKINNVYTNHDSKVISDAMSTSFGMGIGNFRTLEESSYTDTVTSPMYPKFVFDKIGFFDEQLVRNQDDDFNFRVHKAGGKIWFEKDISLDYYVRSNFKGLLKQFYQYGYWKVFVNTKHKTVTTFRQLIPPIFALYAISVLFTPFIPLILASFYLIGIVAYISLLLLISIKRSSNFIDFRSFIKTYLILHFSYGFGYLHGILNFMILKRSPSKNQMKLSR
jgi:glycosyltransferase involved in cell wall biosynthesis